jgi:hypothetical protein
MSAIGTVQARGFALERLAIRAGRAMVAWGERRERVERESQELYRRQAEADGAAGARSAAVRIQMLP